MIRAGQWNGCRLNWFMGQFRLSKQRQFGAASERTHVELQPLFVFNYRQEQQLARLGINLSRQTMANWMLYGGQPVADPAL